MAPNARLIALNILNSLEPASGTLDQVLDAAFSGVPDMSQRDKNLVFSIVYGVLRQQRRLDWMLSHFLKIDGGNVDAPVRNILRIGLFQILFLSRIPDSAAVNTSVELTKIIKKLWATRFVNGVLRNAVRRYAAISLPDLKTDPELAIAIEQSMPDWMVRRWIARFGISQTLCLCNVVNNIPPITLRANTLKTTRDDLMRAMTGHVREADITSLSPDGLRLYHPETAVSALPGFSEGLFQVQDEAAQLVTMLLNPQPGETVLDACAGMGGKTGHIAQQMHNQGRVMALDIRQDKLKKIRAEMLRLGISIVETGCHDLTQSSSSGISLYDRVLLDAPCSGLGVLRRNPDIKWRSSLERIRHCAAEQLRLLEQVSRYVKPGGCIVYAVCSMEPEENESVIESFLQHHSEYRVDDDAGGMSCGITLPMDSCGYLRTFPHLHDMDGFFAVRLKKND
jgi:16S rRNA (cytosine967-C5)-methyltransferase